MVSYGFAEMEPVKRSNYLTLVLQLYGSRSSAESFRGFCVRLSGDYSDSGRVVSSGFVAGCVAEAAGLSSDVLGRVRRVDVLHSLLSGCDPLLEADFVEFEERSAVEVEGTSVDLVLVDDSFEADVVDVGWSDRLRERVQSEWSNLFGGDDE